VICDEIQTSWINRFFVVFAPDLLPPWGSHPPRHPSLSASTGLDCPAAPSSTARLRRPRRPGCTDLDGPAAQTSTTPLLRPRRSRCADLELVTARSEEHASPTQEEPTASTQDLFRCINHRRGSCSPKIFYCVVSLKVEDADWLLGCYWLEEFDL